MNTEGLQIINVQNIKYVQTSLLIEAYNTTN